MSREQIGELISSWIVHGEGTKEELLKAPPLLDFYTPSAVVLEPQARALTVRESPVDLGYSIVEGWPNVPQKWKLGIVGGVACGPKCYYVSQRNEAVPPLFSFDRDGEFISSWGEGTKINPHMIRCDPENNIWIVDARNHMLYKISPDNELLATLGTKGVPGEDGSHFSRPADIAFTPDGRLYVADGYDNQRIAIFDKELTFLGQFGTKGTGKGEFLEPHSIAIDTSRWEQIVGKEGLIFVADRRNWRIQVFTKQCAIETEWRHLGCPESIFYAPDGFLYMADDKNWRITKLDTHGNVIGFIGEAEVGFGELNGIHGFSVNKNGDILAACHLNGAKLFIKE